MFNGHTKNLDRKLSNFAVVISTDVLKEISVICLSTKIEYLRCNLDGCLVSSVGIATRHTLDVLGSNLCGEVFSAPIQRAPATHLASCTMGTVTFQD